MLTLNIGAEARSQLAQGGVLLYSADHLHSSGATAPQPSTSPTEMVELGTAVNSQESPAAFFGRTH